MSPDPDPTSDDDLVTLASLVGDLEHFGAQYWGREPLVRTRAAAARIADLLTIERIEELLTTGARRPTFRLVSDGTTLSPDRSTRPMRLGGQVVDDVADLARIAEAIGEGATLVMQGLQRTTTEIARLCRSLERATSHAVQANAYLTPAGATGLSPHRDEHDVIVIQLTGTKAWKIERLGDVVLGPGDVLYLPAGTEHAATAQQRASLHLTIGILTTSYADVLRRLAPRLGDGVLGRPLPLGYARPEHSSVFETSLRAVLDDTIDQLRAADVSIVASKERERSRTRRRPLLSGHLRAMLDLDDIDAATGVRWRHDQPGSLAAPSNEGGIDSKDRADDQIRLRLHDRVVTLPSIGRAALDRLLRGDAVTIGALPGIDEESRVVLARRLVREGALEVVAPGD